MSVNSREVSPSWETEMKLDRRIRLFLARDLTCAGRVMQSPVTDTSPELYDPVEQALDNGIITDGQETRISATDIILRAQRKAGRSPVWVAVEVSNDISQRDIERVRQSAEPCAAYSARTAWRRCRLSHPCLRPGASYRVRRAYPPARRERVDASMGRGQLRLHVRPALLDVGVAVLASIRPRKPGATRQASHRW